MNRDVEMALELLFEQAHGCGGKSDDEINNAYEIIKAALQPQSVDVEAIENNFIKYHASLEIQPATWNGLVTCLLNWLQSQRVLNTGWQTMDSAPKDGTQIIVIGKGWSGAQVVKWKKEGNQGFWFSHYTTTENFITKEQKIETWQIAAVCQPTHWMSLPPPPTGEHHE